MKFYIIVGERSGDLHGGNLVKAIKNLNPGAQFKGFGGDHMRQNGVDISVDYSRLAFMGFIEVLRSLRTVSNFMKQCKREILEYKPDAVILVDYGGFNGRIAAFARKNNIRVIYYISPKVWAWYTSRALKLKRNVNKMIVILPFEKEFYKKFDWEVDYVGNPVLDAVKDHQVDQNFLKSNNIDPIKKIVALLPGSRKQELQRMIVVMADVVKRFPEIQFMVAAVNNLDESLYGELKGLVNVKFIYEDTYNLLAHADAAIVTSGTATLETALFKVPQVVIYKAGKSTYAIVKLIIKVKFIGLVNLIAGKEVVRELIQEELNTDSLEKELKSLVFDDRYRTKMVADYDAIYNTLDVGSASSNASYIILKYLQG
jgi:lipid-A-disaccharide synthase